MAIGPADPDGHPHLEMRSIRSIRSWLLVPPPPPLVPIRLHWPKKGVPGEAEHLHAPLTGNELLAMIGRYGSSAVHEMTPEDVGALAIRDIVRLCFATLPALHPSGAGVFEYLEYLGKEKETTGGE